MSSRDSLEWGEKRLSLRARLTYAAKIVATLVLLTATAIAVDTEKLAQALGGIDPGWLGLAAVCSAAFVWMRVVKWKLLTRANGLHAPTTEIARTMLMSYALGIVTPGRVGEVVVIAPFPRESRAMAVMAYVYDRIGELCMVILFSIPAAIIFLGPIGLAVGATIVAGCATSVALIEWRDLRLKFCAIARLDRMPKLNAVLSAEMRAPASYWVVCFITYILAYVLLSALIIGAGSGLNWRGFSILPVVTLSNLISITIGGLGVREGLAAALALLTDISPEVAAAAFFLSFVFTRVIAGIVGLVWVFLTSAKKAEAPSRI